MVAYKTGGLGVAGSSPATQTKIRLEPCKHERLQGLCFCGKYEPVAN